MRDRPLSLYFLKTAGYVTIHPGIERNNKNLWTYRWYHREGISQGGVHNGSTMGTLWPVVLALGAAWPWVIMWGGGLVQPWRPGRHV